jgi:hypothetical protein
VPERSPRSARRPGEREPVRGIDMVLYWRYLSPKRAPTSVEAMERGKQLLEASSAREVVSCSRLNILADLARGVRVWAR